MPNHLGFHPDAKRINSWALANHAELVPLEGCTETVSNILSGINDDGLAQVSDCLHFLDMVKALADPTIGRAWPKKTDTLAAYSAKHRVERWAGRYVSTHAWVVVGLYRGIFSKRSYDWKLPAALVGLLDGIYGGSRGGWSHQGTVELSWSPSKERRAGEF